MLLAFYVRKRRQEATANKVTRADFSLLTSALSGSKEM